MSDVFGAAYADAYDALYHDKDYAGECDCIERICRQVGDGGAMRRILDLGCGTGNHAVLLAQRGYDVVGVDRAADMVTQAQRKAAALGNGHGPRFVQGDVRDVRVEGVFDAALMMFAVLSYQLGNEDVLAALRTARRHLRPGGLFIADVWYGPAVLTQRPRPVVKSCTSGAGEILRTSTGTLDVRRHTCRVDFQVWRTEGDRVVARTTEQHTVRYFYPLELELLLASAGFELVRLGAFPDFAREPDDATWNVLLAARVTGGRSGRR